MVTQGKCAERVCKASEQCDHWTWTCRNFRFETDSNVLACPYSCSPNVPFESCINLMQILCVLPDSHLHCCHKCRPRTSLPPTIYNADEHKTTSETSLDRRPFRNGSGGWRRRRRFPGVMVRPRVNLCAEGRVRGGRSFASAEASRQPVRLRVSPLPDGGFLLSGF